MALISLRILIFLDAPPFILPVSAAALLFRTAHYAVSRTPLISCLRFSDYPGYISPYAEKLVFAYSRLFKRISIKPTSDSEPCTLFSASRNDIRSVTFGFIFSLPAFFKSYFTPVPGLTEGSSLRILRHGTNQAADGFRLHRNSTSPRFPPGRLSTEVSLSPCVSSPCRKPSGISGWCSPLGRIPGRTTCSVRSGGVFAHLPSAGACAPTRECT